MVEKNGATVALDIEKILQILPQRAPFLLVDPVDEVAANRYARGRKCVSYSEPSMRGHFQSQPIMPGVLVLEALSQLSSILAFASDPFDPSQNQMYFLGCDNVRFRRSAKPGDRLDLYVEILEHHSNVWRFQAEALIEDTVCTTATLLASVVSRG